MVTNVNNEGFANRLQIIIKYYGESASSFAEKIGIQRSSISHILSGRNKPSLDFVLKVLSAFPEVELYWLMNGTGEFPKTEPHVQIHRDAPKESPITSLDTDLPKEIIKKTESHKHKTNKTIDRIVIFYSDGSFKNYEH